nr:MAG TPA: hypothetical protein [Caudoviricetes sp.]
MLNICLLGTYFVFLHQKIFYSNSITFIIDTAKIEHFSETTKHYSDFVLILSFIKQVERMNTTIKDRTIEFVKHKGITMKTFEQRCGLSSGYVTSMRKGFGSDKLSNVLTAFPELNRDWLLYGEGEMIKGNVSQTSHGDNSPNINGNGNHLEPNSSLLDKALDEIAAMRKALTDALEVNQKNTDRLLNIIENMSK